MKVRKVTPILIHHRPKPNPQTGYRSSSRGATAFPNMCRFHIMLEGNGAGVKLKFEKISRGAKPGQIELVFDEARRLFVPKEKEPDHYVSAFQVGEDLTTSQFMERVGKDPKDDKGRDKVLDILRQRSNNGGPIRKVAEAKKGQEAVWQRVV